MRKFKDRMLKKFLAAAFILAIAAHGFGQTADDQFGREIDQLFSAYNQNTAGVAAAVVKDGKVIFQKGYGAANLEYAAPVTTKTVFNVASVSKQFTAFAIYLLEKQGKLSLEDDVRKYVAEVPDFGKTVRIKHLLGHTGGIRDQAALMSLAGWRTGDSVTTAQILGIISRQKKLNFAPGERYLYSNTGYTLLAEIVRQVSGQSFAEFTKKNMFEPLGMRDTVFYDDYGRIVKNRADSYELENGVYKKVNLVNASPGSSNLYTTVEDMAKWALNFENPKVGDARMIARFNEPSLLNNGERAIYYADGDDVGYHAKGQIQRIYRGANVLSHGGHTAGFRSTFWRFPDQRFALILLSNDEHFAQLKNGEALADLYLADVLKPKRKANQAAAASKPLEKSNVDLTDYEGRFDSAELETSYDAESKNGKLFLRHIRHGEIALEDAGRDKFTGRIGFPVELEFVRDQNGKIDGFKVSNFGAKNVRFDKAERK